MLCVSETIYKTNLYIYLFYIYPNHILGLKHISKGQYINKTGAWEKNLKILEK